MANTTGKNQENIFDLTLRIYGTLEGLGEIMPNFSSLDDSAPAVVEYEEDVVFSDFVEPSPVIEKKNVINFTVRKGQSIYDLAIQTGGSLLGLKNVLKYFDNLEEDLRGQLLQIEQNNDQQLEVIQNRGLLFATARIDLNNWILETGFWEDSGEWIDIDNWID